MFYATEENVLDFLMDRAVQTEATSTDADKTEEETATASEDSTAEDATAASEDSTAEAAEADTTAGTEAE